MTHVLTAASTAIAIAALILADRIDADGGPGACRRAWQVLGVATALIAACWGGLFWWGR
jgi:hypothetical protein